MPRLRSQPKSNFGSSRNADAGRFRTPLFIGLAYVLINLNIISPSSSQGGGNGGKKGGGGGMGGFFLFLSSHFYKLSVINLLNLE